MFKTLRVSKYKRYDEEQMMKNESFNLLVKDLKKLKVISLVGKQDEPKVEKILKGIKSVSKLKKYIDGMKDVYQMVSNNKNYFSFFRVDILISEGLEKLKKIKT